MVTENLNGNEKDTKRISIRSRRVFRGRHNKSRMIRKFNERINNRQYHREDYGKDGDLSELGISSEDRQMWQGITRS